jgi:hypothetical protein
MNQAGHSIGRRSRESVRQRKKAGKLRTDREYRKPDGTYFWGTESDALGEFGGASLSTPESLLVAAVMEDAVRVISKGHPAEWWGKRDQVSGLRYHNYLEVYLDSIVWMLVDVEPDSPFSFHWCIEFLSAYLGLDYDAAAIRERVRRMDLINQTSIDEALARYDVLEDQR